MPETAIPAMSCTGATPVDIPGMVLVSRDGTLPPSLTPFTPGRIDDVTTAEPTDDVVVLYGFQSAADIARLRQRLGRHMPAVLVIGRVFDPRDIVTAFDNGATSYIVAGEPPEFCVVEAVLRTAQGENILSPSATTALLSRLRRVPLGRLPAPGSGQAINDELTAREHQVMELLVGGHTVAEIGNHLRVTNKTVRSSLSRIYGKLHVRCQSEAILLWLGHRHDSGGPERDNTPRPRLRLG